MSLADEGKNVDRRSAAANAAFMRLYPGERAAPLALRIPLRRRAPLQGRHHRARLGELALRSLDQPTRRISHAGGRPRGCDQRGLHSATRDLAALYDRVARQAAARADRGLLRLDFEDGFGARPDAEEDAVAESSAREVLTAPRAAGCCRCSSVFASSHSARSGRIAVRERWASTVDTLLAATGGRVPDNRGDAAQDHRRRAGTRAGTACSRSSSAATDLPAGALRSGRS